MTNEVVWMEFTKSGKLTQKRRGFKTAEAMERFIQKLFDKDSFYKILATR